MSWIPITKKQFNKDRSPEERRKTTSKKQKIPTSFITKFVFCRNCNARNREKDRVCVQCERELINPRKRKAK